MPKLLSQIVRGNFFPYFLSLSFFTEIPRLNAENLLNEVGTMGLNLTPHNYLLKPVAK